MAKKKKNVLCKGCEALKITENDLAHQQHCLDFEEEDADRLRKALKEIEIGWWADQVLEVHSSRHVLNLGTEGINKDHIWNDPYFNDLEEDHPHYKFKGSYVVEWVLPGVTLTLARGFTIDPLSGGELSVYAVQRIRSNDERKRPIKPKPKKSRVT